MSIQGVAMRIFLLACLGIIFLLMLFEKEDEDDEKNKNKKGNRNFFSIIIIYLAKLKPGFSNKKILTKKLFSTPSGNIIVIFVIINILIFGVTISAFNQGSNSVEPTNFARGYENIVINDNESRSLYVFVYDLKIKSHGIFNWINKVELQLNGTESEVVYVWDIPYSFNGDFSIKGAIPISKGLINGSGNYFIDLYYTIYSSGLFAQPPSTQDYNHSFAI